MGADKRIFDQFCASRRAKNAGPEDYCLLPAPGTNRHPSIIQTQFQFPQSDGHHRMSDRQRDAAPAKPWQSQNNRRAIPGTYNQQEMPCQVSQSSVRSNITSSPGNRYIPTSFHSAANTATQLPHHYQGRTSFSNLYTRTQSTNFQNPRPMIVYRPLANITRFILHSNSYYLLLRWRTRSYVPPVQWV